MRHHYVPEFFQQPWAAESSDKRVEVFRLDLAGLPSKRHTPKHTGYENDLYALTKSRVAGMEQHAMEKHFLKRIDQFASIARDKMVSNGLKSLSIDDQGHWLRFLASLRVRQPSTVRLIRESGAKAFRDSIAMNPEEYETLKSQSDPKRFEDWIETQYPGLIENFGMSFFHKIVLNRDLLSQLSTFKWWLWNFSSTKHKFLLCDNPLIMTSGIQDPDLVLCLPITPKIAFLGTRNERVERLLKQQDPHGLQIRINELIVNQAKVRIYAT